MLKTHALILALGVFLGSIVSFMFIMPSMQEIQTTTLLLQKELKRVSNQPSVSHSPQECKPLTLSNISTGEDLSPQHNELTDFLAEMKSEILLTVEQSLQNDTLANNSSSADGFINENVALQMERAESVVSSVIANGMLSDADVNELNASLDGLSGDAVAETYRQLMVAINRGEVEINTSTLFR